MTDLIKVVAGAHSRGFHHWQIFAKEITSDKSGLPRSSSALPADDLDVLLAGAPEAEHMKPDDEDGAKMQHTQESRDMLDKYLAAARSVASVYEAEGGLVVAVDENPYSRRDFPNGGSIYLATHAKAEELGLRTFKEGAKPKKAAQGVSA